MMTWRSPPFLSPVLRRLDPQALSISCLSYCSSGRGCQDFFAGTFLPAFLALDNPIAMACFLLFTFLLLRPLLSVPFFLAFISLSTLLPTAREYFRDGFFFPVDFFFEVFFVA